MIDAVDMVYRKTGHVCDAVAIIRIRMLFLSVSPEKNIHIIVRRLLENKVVLTYLIVEQASEKSLSSIPSLITREPFTCPV
jgi:hypothetical protein